MNKSEQARNHHRANLQAVQELSDKVLKGIIHRQTSHRKRRIASMSQDESPPK